MHRKSAMSITMAARVLCNVFHIDAVKLVGYERIEITDPEQIRKVHEIHEQIQANRYFENGGWAWELSFGRGQRTAAYVLTTEGKDRRICDCRHCGRDIWIAEGDLMEFRHVVTGEKECANYSPNLSGKSFRYASPTPRCPDCNHPTKTTQESWLDRTTCTNLACTGGENGKPWESIRMIGD